VDEISSQRKPLRIIQTENPEKEIWSMLSYFESEHNAKQYLQEKVSKGVFSSGDLDGAAKSLAFNMQAAKEYYKSAESATILTKPLLLYYGMVCLSKVLYVALKGIAPEGKKHGLGTLKPWDHFLANLSVKVKKYGMFAEFYHCYSTEELSGFNFSIKQLFSLIPEIKVAFETVYKEKSRALKVLRTEHGINVVDSELQTYVDLEKLVSQIPRISERYHKNYQRTNDALFLFCMNDESEDPVIHTISGEEFLVLPVSTATGNVVLPEQSTHFLIMFLLGMLARYQPKEWGGVIKGEESGEIYIIQNFLDVTKSKFPILILNELREREFVFSIPRIGAKEKLTEEQLDEIYDYVNRRMAEEIRRRLY
jgi:hypothetical protein